ncbi:DUF1223 domain-containing protein [Dyadobacter arcticus]|uniref:DUF1223 domain-containing protein n=1 Tax=Dyadobacter arcticus TaxID=1078754 RepID=A0ABX0UKE4_9BACT|nr:DUF1223 domain-containing protein [Dyadobacter arcticus]NIJ52544.1 hypothetical protein [Dyadobacter arcticus]
MKILSFSTVTLIISLFIAASIPDSQFKSAGRAEGSPGFAVVELFTSEGCSSCPSADALIARIQKENNDKPVYILAFHVDYWNRLGWKDVFSDPAFTKRQRQYASWLKLSSVYTPQAVINGSTEFVGSQETSMRKAITEGLGKKAAVTIGLEHVKASGNQVAFDYQINGTIANSSLTVALVQRKAESRIRSGENAGRTLSHVQITRAIQTLILSGNSRGKTQIAIPRDVKASELELLVLLQNNQDGSIIAASKAALESHT